MIFLGIDPGLQGALAVLDARGQLLSLVDTPCMHVGPKREYDRREVKRILQGLHPGLQCVVPGQTRPRVVRPGEAIPVDNPRERTIQDADLLIACVELVHAMPGQGVVSMWRMGQGFELWMMALTMLDAAVETVTPQRWKGIMLDGLPKGKDASRLRAKALWPQWAERFSRVKDDGRAEACLIAEYIRRQWVKA